MRLGYWILAVVCLVGAVVLAQERAAPPASQSPLLYAPTYDECMRKALPVVTRKDIYHDATQPEDKRLDDLIAQMTLDEKTVECATLYGYRRVLPDYLPTEDWRTKDLWKD